MRGLKRIGQWAIVLAFALAFSASTAEAADYGQMLFDIVLKQFQPEKVTMTLSSPPRENGMVPRSYFEVTGAHIGGLRIASLKADCFEAMVTPPGQWQQVEYPKIKSALTCRAEAVVTESDVNEFLRTRAFGDKAEWSAVKVRMNRGRVGASAYYLADLKLFKLKIKLEVSCVVKPRHSSELWLEDIRLKVNGSRVSPHYVESALSKLQPVIDLKRYNLPLYPWKVDFDRGVCRIRSRILPKAFEGLQWRL